MKIVEILDGIRMALNNEQADLYGRFKHQKTIPKADLDDREQLIANQLCTHDLVIRSNQKGKIIYRLRKDK
jgi:hypothetical protein